MAIGHARGKYGNDGQERASMDNYGSATGKSFSVRTGMLGGNRILGLRMRINQVEDPLIWWDLGTSLTP